MGRLVKPKIYDAPFGKLAYTICTNVDQYEKFCKQHNVPVVDVPDDADACVYNHTDGDSRISIIMAFDRSMDHDYLCGLLAHECVHVWQNYVDIICEHDPSDEFEAYTIQEIFTNILTEYRRQTNETKT